METIERLRATVAALCSPATAGRAPGTPQGAAARAVVLEEFTDLGLAPAGEAGYHQLLPAMGGANLLGAIPGDRPGWIVLGAHYDHLGGSGDRVYWGADDNAAGVAVMLEVARQLAAGSDRGRSILVSAYDAEEPPWFGEPAMGSQWWVDHPTVPLAEVELMICLDLVGHRLGPAGLPPGVGDTIFVQGGDLAPGLAATVTVPAVQGIIARPIADWVIDPMSDHLAFRQAGIPHLFYTCARSAVYHEPTDRPELLAYDKMAALVTHLTATVEAARRAPPGSWRFDADAADDATTLETVRTIAAGVPGLGTALATLLDGTVPDASGRLGAAQRHALRAMVATVEDRLA
jgi:Zn-dependent M28 family amino/carboxypeptidase